MRNVKIFLLFAVMACNLLTTGCITKVVESVAEVVVESMIASFGLRMTQIGFARAHYRETGKWPETGQELKNYCQTKSFTEFCETFDGITTMSFEPVPEDPNRIKYEWVCNGVEASGSFTLDDFPADATPDEIIAGHIETFRAMMDTFKESDK